jgi:hypothetical protein
LTSSAVAAAAAAAPTAAAAAPLPQSLQAAHPQDLPAPLLHSATALLLQLVLRSTGAAAAAEPSVAARLLDVAAVLLGTSEAQVRLPIGAPQLHHSFRHTLHHETCIATANIIIHLVPIAFACTGCCHKWPCKVEWCLLAVHGLQLRVVAVCLAGARRCMPTPMPRCMPCSATPACAAWQ